VYSNNYRLTIFQCVSVLITSESQKTIIINVVRHSGICAPGQVFLSSVLTPSKLSFCFSCVGIGPCVSVSDLSVDSYKKRII